MEIKTWASGGYAGDLARDLWVLDTEQLSEADRAAVEDIVNRSGFFDMPAELARARGNDLVSTVIDVTDGRRNHSVTVDSDTEQKYKDALDPIFEVVRKKGSKALT